jgi:RNA polymerase sigma factor (sigma-70 family)
MATANVSDFLRRLMRGMVAETLADQSDRQLVERFLAGRGEAVFEAIVRRHGAMVYRVCWRVLRHHQDAEDAFQATFLVLAQKLRSNRKRASLACWLHGVAHRVALKAKAKAATRRRHEAQAPVSQRVPADDVTWAEVRAILDAELARMPEKWRLPLVLCYLEGRTQDEAAAQLDWSPRTFRRRLEEARAGLGRRLSRRGVIWSAALPAVLFSDSMTSAALSPGLVDTTVQAASLFAAGQTAAAGLISVKAAVLTEGVLKTMFLSKLKIAVVAFLVIGTLGIGISAQTRGTLAADPPPAGSKSALPSQDEGNLKETVLALEKRIWEAHTKQDVNTFKSLLADDYVGLDIHRDPYTKAGALEYVSKYRVEDAAMSNVKVILLNATSALVTYEIRFKVRSKDGKLVETRADHNTTAWARRNGKWWAVFTEGTVLADHRWKAADTWEMNDLRFFDKDRTDMAKPESLSESLKKLNSEKNAPKK